MADNYEQATVEPTIPETAVSEEELSILEQCGFEWVKEHNHLYFYAQDGINDEEDWIGTFQNILGKTPDTSSIVVQGAYTCSKMRPGEFGGFLTYITKDNHKFADISDIRTFFEKGKWQYSDCGN